MLHDLPFIKAGEVFGLGSWAGGGFGVDQGETHYVQGGISHNGIRTFKKFENEQLENILNNTNWVEKVPCDEYEVLQLFKQGDYDITEAANRLRKIISATVSHT